ncbi:MAG: hypothetical protein EYC62_00785 [Alphaproteobacteria bacterium]|nr:MAG: hypothetical protein EYC62_00785 [Alphaproteobacteria bacterium]
MALPKREYYYLQEVVQKLEITEFDLQYYLSHGQMLGCTWINKSMFIHEQKGVSSKDGQKAHSAPYEGYVTLSPNDCREIFTTGFVHAREFFDYPEVRLIVPEEQPAILIRRGGLMVSMWDFEFFVEQYLSGKEKKPNRGGRPSVMKKVLEEHERRIQRNEAYKHNTREALTLRQWAELHFKNREDVPSQNTIRNALITYKPNSHIKQQSEDLHTAV